MLVSGGIFSAFSFGSLFFFRSRNSIGRSPRSLSQDRQICVGVVFSATRKAEKLAQLGTNQARVQGCKEPPSLGGDGGDVRKKTKPGEVY